MVRNLLNPLYSSRKRILITASFLFIGIIIVGMIVIQAWFDYEVKRQLTATETNINSIEILDISFSTKSANLTINASMRNPHNLKISASETNLSVNYGSTNLGIVRLPKIEVQKNIEFLEFNTTLILGSISWLTYIIFGSDLVYDGEVAVNVTGQLTLSAPALFYTVYSTVDIETEIIVTTDIISYIWFN
ncbi:MAG: hypothetical protein ACW98I_18665 [Candidatus Hodarchaeales archaeon]